ncbi:saccharopine dehydrogenase family protein [Sphingomicrobium flavum]|uniref:saccharopine dehydrogenase family protein n=1 Tax=Sphingomicrobium flavum TaxID=1229164 RepID=UPI0021AD7C4C|nr:saccharopine dehydrogenase NADP-binding domain-containing protein [Sphingomicrobium flavum]
MLRLMIVGASGVFGSRLARLAAGEPGVELVLAGRRRGPLEVLAEELGASLRVLDRDAVGAGDLFGIDLVVDCAGPFQESSSMLVEAALAAGVDYLDLADGRDWVCNFEARWDEAARRAGVRLVSGASSIPALSHAVIDRLVQGWRQVDDLWVGIFPGNRAPRGPSVVEAILSYVGKPVREFEHGGWHERRGWGGLQRVDCGRAGKRWASICDVPEQELLVRRYQPRRSAQFFAGMELSLLHVGLWLLSWPVRWGWLKSLRPFAAPMLEVAEWVKPLGSDKGAMLVKAKGLDAMGRPAKRAWRLNADANRGPYVPVLAALALVRQWRDGVRPAAGARICSGMLDLEDFEWDFARLGLDHVMCEQGGRGWVPPARFAA